MSDRQLTFEEWYETDRKCKPIASGNEKSIPCSLTDLIRWEREAWNACQAQEKRENEELKIKFSEATKTYTDDIDELQKKVEELESYKKQNDVDLNAMQAYVDRNFEIQSENTVLKDGSAYQKQENEALKKKLSEAVEVIKFYGNPEKWINRHKGSWDKCSPKNFGDEETIFGYAHPKTDWIGTVVVGGKRARAFLKENKDE